MKKDIEIPSCMLRNDFNHIMHLISPWSEFKTTTWHFMKLMDKITKMNLQHKYGIGEPVFNSTKLLVNQLSVQNNSTTVNHNFDKLLSQYNFGFLDPLPFFTVQSSSGDLIINLLIIPVNMIPYQLNLKEVLLLTDIALPPCPKLVSAFWSGKLEIHDQPGFYEKIIVEYELICASKMYYMIYMQYEHVDCFMKNINSPDVYEKTVDDLIDHYQRFQFPCPDHKCNILAFSIKYYLNIRMKQWSRNENRETIKTNAKKKKFKYLYTVLEDKISVLQNLAIFFLFEFYAINRSTFNRSTH
ncbi:hypothetical protein AGLY_018173 [Aphis glycines]|uniref:Uncharacterized protein n=1 Tax=Aphis glycines TaxID=307491 RepID=A0A6G0STY9_APHGL|nr:hypothetical protein AGLY_018173 [Aphis glycines]